MTHTLRAHGPGAVLATTTRKPDYSYRGCTQASDVTSDSAKITKELATRIGSRIKQSSFRTHKNQPRPREALADTRILFPGHPEAAETKAETLVTNAEKQGTGPRNADPEHNTDREDTL